MSESSQIIDGPEWDKSVRRLMEACKRNLVVEHALSSARFEIGDAWNDGDRQHGEEWAQAVPELPLARKTIRNCAYVASRIQGEQRDHALPWTHFREVAALPEPVQAKLLREAQEEGLTTRQLAKRIDPERDDPLPPEPATRQREEPIRLPEYLKWMRGQRCQLRTPDCTDGPGMGCHSNRQADGKGKGVKAHDVFVAIGCAACHRWLDEGASPRGDKEAVFDGALRRTLEIAFRAGVLGWRG